MYRTADPRFRRRLNELENTLERANESAQSGLYIFGENYVKPCLESITTCMTSCIDASCPSLNLSQRDRIRRQRGRARSRGRAELDFDFYDDWEEDETDGLIGWANDELDPLAGSGGGYGTIANTQPGRQRGMSYPKGGVPPRDSDPSTIPGSSLFGKLFGGKALRYKPTAAGLQEHPGARKLGRDMIEGEALLEDGEVAEGAKAKTKRNGRHRSDTVGSGQTTDSYSSRGDIFPSDEEDDAIPLDDEFAMVLERRTTNSGFTSGPETESSSTKGKRRKRPSLGQTSSTKRTVSSRSTRSNEGKRRSSSNNLQSPIDNEVPTLSELKQQERLVEMAEEAELERRRSEAQRLASERGLTAEDIVNSSSKDATPANTSPEVAAIDPPAEPSQLPTPSATDDEQDDLANHQQQSRLSTDGPPKA